MYKLLGFYIFSVAYLYFSLFNEKKYKGNSYFQEINLYKSKI